MTRKRRLLVTSMLVGVAAASSLTHVTRVARAEGNYGYDHDHHDDDFHTSTREGVLVQVGMIYGAVRADEAKLHTLQSVPGPLDGRDLRLDGGTTMMGGMLAAHFMSKGFRVGFVESFAGAQGLKLLHEPIGDGYSVEASAWRLSFELSVGHQFAVGKLSPYADLRVGYSMLNATVKLVDPRAGVLGSTNYTAWAPVIGPRVGVLVPISKSALVDLALTYGLLGHDAVGLSLGVGYGIGRLGL
jgi:hypothetical protein